TNNAGGSGIVGPGCTLATNSAGAAAVIDLAGNDHYVSGRRCGINGGGFGGAGFLLDAAGSDTYTAGDGATNGAGIQGAGVLLDLGGTDHYADGMGGTGFDKTVAPKGTGAQIDVQGPQPCSLIPGNSSSSTAAASAPVPGAHETVPLMAQDAKW